MLGERQKEDFLNWVAKVRSKDRLQRKRNADMRERASTGQSNGHLEVCRLFRPAHVALGCVSFLVR